MVGNRGIWKHGSDFDSFFLFPQKKRTMKQAQSEQGLLEAKGKTSTALPQRAQTVFLVRLLQRAQLLCVSQSSVAVLPSLLFEMQEQN